MGRQRNKPQSKGKEESPEKELNEIETSNLSDIEFKIMVIRMLKELSENYKELYERYKELRGNYSSMKKGQTINKNQKEMKSTISEVKNTLEGITSRLDEADHQISELEDNVERKTQAEQQNVKRLKKNKDCFREFQENMKHNNIHIIAISEGKEKEQGLENMFEKILTENFLKLVRGKVMQFQKAQRVPTKMNPKRSAPRPHHN